MKYLIKIFLVTVILGLSVGTAVAANPTSLQNSPETIIAGMSDEDVRQLLIKELKNQALADLDFTKKQKHEKSNLVIFIEDTKDRITLFQERIQYLKSGEPSKESPMSGLFNYLAKGEVNFSPIRTISILFLIFAAAFLIEFVFNRYVSPLRKRLLSDPPESILGKAGRSGFCTLIDGILILIFITAAIFCFYFSSDQSQGTRLMMATYLAAIVAVRLTLIVSRFFLSPKSPEIRFLPMKSSVASYLYRWIIAISIVSSFGLLTCGIMKLAGTSEADHIKSLFMVALILSGMLIAMIFQKRSEVAQYLSGKLPLESQQAKLSQKWHHFGIFFVFLLLAASTGNMIIGNYGNYVAIKTLAMLPAYFLVDWVLVNILKVLVGFIPSEKPAQKETDSTETVSEGNSMLAHVEFSRIKKTIVPSLRFALAALFIIWTLNIWGIELPIGKAIAKASFNILVVVLVCYSIWEFLNISIQRRLKLEMPEEEEEMEEGGAGGSRIGTLLLLFRKFLLVFILFIAIMIILSSMGIDIGPLIAGAGVIGLAIGFGAQTLVKDIISGVFFLVDDAFRVGDYIEVGNTKGMVEQISLRSFKLRHPRGMVNTIPFGDISSVTNFSRDYIITKLDFRVKYDTDIEKVRKIIKKKVYKVILKDEELATKLLGKIKSQGVRQLEDSAMIMRIKFKTIPGEQFAIRKEVFRLLQEAFKFEGIEFAHKNVTVYIPPENSNSESASNGSTRKKMIEAAAAAAAAEEQTPKG